METYFQNMAAAEGSKEKLVRDLNVLLRDAEALIKAAGRTLSDKSKDQLMAALARFKASCSRVEQEAGCAVRSTDQFVRQYPFTSVGVAFGLGLLLGVLVGRD